MNIIYKKLSFFHRNYSSIRDSEQRRQYKADFTADYSEYRDLHAEVEKVSKRFAQLEERLRQEERNSPAWKVIKFNLDYA
jgi:RNA polymerase II elongation factor ELL